MQSKSTRGVQQDEVWAAADALIAAGERPTIERVRLKIGRGSPNTVSPMLDSWFATLATRLGVPTTGAQVEEGPPKALLQALEKVWAAAVASARDEADRALELERDRLAQQGLKLDIARQELHQRETALTERGIAFEHALELAKSQLLDQTAQIGKASSDLEQARATLASLAQERDAGRRQFDEQLGVLTQERERLEQRSSTNERRFLEQVDRARQEAKQLFRALEDARQKHRTEKESLEHVSAELGSRAHEGQLELATLRERLQGAEGRMKELERALAVATESRRATKDRAIKPRPSGRSTAGTVAKRSP